MDIPPLTDTWILAKTRRHRTTVKRWRDARRLPPELVELARLELEGELALIHDKWRGWKLNPKTGEIVTPEGLAYMPAELVAFRYRIAALEQRARERVPWWRRWLSRGRRRGNG